MHNHFISGLFISLLLGAEVGAVLINIRGYQRAILQSHNLYRSFEPASNMRYLMIWATTSRVGCSVSYCPIIRVGFRTQRNAMYFVCKYYPAGNIIGQYPYIPGRRCSRCGFGARCIRGLCAGGSGGFRGFRGPRRYFPSRFRFFGRRKRSVKFNKKDEFLELVCGKAKL